MRLRGNYFKKLAIEKGHTIRYIEGYEKKERVATVSTIDTILNARDILKKKYCELVMLHGKVTRDENFQITKYAYKRRLGVDKLNREILEMYFRKEQNIKNFISLISPKITYNEKAWNEKDIFDTNRIMKRNIAEEIIKTLDFSLTAINKSIPYEQFKENIEKLIETSAVFTKFNETRSLFDLRKQKKWIFNEKLRSTVLYLNAILAPYNLKIMKHGLEGKRKVAPNSIYTLEFVNYIDHIVDNLLKKEIISYNEKDSIHIKKVINIESKNHFDDLIKKKVSHLKSSRV